MQPRTRIGLIVGVIGLILNVCVSGFIGFRGPFLSLAAGGTKRNELIKHANKANGTVHWLYNLLRLSRKEERWQTKTSVAAR